MSEIPKIRIGISVGGQFILNNYIYIYFIINLSSVKGFGFRLTNVLSD